MADGHVEVDAPFVRRLLRQCRQRHRQVRVAQQFAAAPRHHLVQIGVFGEGAQRLGRHPVRPRHAQAGAELQLGDGEAGLFQPRHRVFRLLVFHRRVAGVQAHAQVAAHDGFGLLALDPAPFGHLVERGPAQEVQFEEGHRVLAGGQQAIRLRLQRQHDAATAVAVQAVQEDRVFQQMGGNPQRGAAIPAQVLAIAAGHGADAAVVHFSGSSAASNWASRLL